MKNHFNGLLFHLIISFSVSLKLNYISLRITRKSSSFQDSSFTPTKGKRNPLVNIIVNFFYSCVVLIETDESHVQQIHSNKL